MERLQRLLLGRFHRHGLNPRTPRGFEQGFRVRSVRLIAAHVGLHVLDGHQLRLMPVRLTAAPPIVRRPAGLHHHRRAGWQPVDKRLKLPACQARALENPAGPIRRRHFKDLLCQVHRDRRSIHIGLLFVQLVEPKPSPRHRMPRTNGEESIPTAN